jgi:hypothetical protein
MSLIEVLAECRNLTNLSQDAPWCPVGIQEVLAVLDRGIAAIEGRSEVNRDELKLVFAPTGALQDTAIANGWGDEYLSLAARFDTLIREDAACYGTANPHGKRPWWKSWV